MGLRKGGKRLQTTERKRLDETLKNREAAQVKPAIRAGNSADFDRQLRPDFRTVVLRDGAYNARCWCKPVEGCGLGGKQGWNETRKGRHVSLRQEETWRRRSDDFDAVADGHGTT